jgi:hypothetical protein
MIAAPFDPYTVLGLPRDASAGQIKVRRRKLLAQVHPDRVTQTDADEVRASNAESAAVNAAADALLDAGRRSAIDLDIQRWEERQASRSSPRRQRSAAGRARAADTGHVSPARATRAGRRPSQRTAAVQPPLSAALVHTRAGQWMAFCFVTLFLLPVYPGLGAGITAAIAVCFLLGQAFVAGHWERTPAADMWGLLWPVIRGVARATWQVAHG